LLGSELELDCGKLELDGGKLELDGGKLELLLASTLELLGLTLELLGSLDDNGSAELLLSSKSLYLCCTSSLSGNAIFELSVQDKKRIRANPRQKVVLLLKYIYEGEYRNYIHPLTALNSNSG